MSQGVKYPYESIGCRFDSCPAHQNRDALRRCGCMYTLRAKTLRRQGTHPLLLRFPFRASPRRMKARASSDGVESRLSASLSRRPQSFSVKSTLKGRDSFSGPFGFRPAPSLAPPLAFMRKTYSPFEKESIYSIDRLKTRDYIQIVWLR